MIWQRLLAKSGMTNGASQSVDEIVDNMVAVFDRRVPIQALDSLVAALRPTLGIAVVEEAAIAFDANAVLRIPQHKKSSDIVDYVSVKHTGPIILPGQVIQEYWNNQLAVVDTVSKGMQKKFDAFKDEVEKSGRSKNENYEKIRDGLEAFKDDNSELFHPDTVRKTLTFLDALVDKAAVPYAPRMAFHKIAEQRKRVKTPPGFCDDGDGDFYVWVDALYGLSKMMQDGATPQRLILVTNDGKIDWCREGEAHPVLCAEAKALLGIDFEIWTLDKFSQAVAS